MNLRFVKGGVVTGLPLLAFLAACNMILGNDGAVVDPNAGSSGDPGSSSGGVSSSGDPPSGGSSSGNPVGSSGVVPDGGPEKFKCPTAGSDPNILVCEDFENPSVVDTESNHDNLISVGLDGDRSSACVLMSIGDHYPEHEYAFVSVKIPVRSPSLPIQIDFDLKIQSVPTVSYEGGESNDGYGKNGGFLMWKGDYTNPSLALAAGVWGALSPNSPNSPNSPKINPYLFNANAGNDNALRSLPLGGWQHITIKLYEEKENIPVVVSFDEPLQQISAVADSFDLDEPTMFGFARGPGPLNVPWKICYDSIVIRQLSGGSADGVSDAGALAVSDGGFEAPRPDANAPRPDAAAPDAGANGEPGGGGGEEPDPGGSSGLGPVVPIGD